MSATSLQLRKTVADAIEAARAGGDLVYDGFDVEESYLPALQLADSELTTGKVWVIALGKDDTGITRANTFGSEIPIQIAYQQLVEDTDTATLDTLMQLAEELRKVAANAVSNVELVNADGGGPITPSWLRNDALRDPTGAPYHFTGMRERSTFEAYFTAIYQVTEK